MLCSPRTDRGKAAARRQDRYSCSDCAQLGSAFLFLTICRKSRRLLLQSFVLAHTNGQARDQRSHRCSVSTQTLRDIFKLIAQPPDKYISDQRPRLRDLPAAIGSFSVNPTARLVLSGIGFHAERSRKAAVYSVPPGHLSCRRNRTRNLPESSASRCRAVRSVCVNS